MRGWERRTSATPATLSMMSEGTVGTEVTDLGNRFPQVWVFEGSETLSL